MSTRLSTESDDEEDDDDVFHLSQDSFVDSGLQSLSFHMEGEGLFYCYSFVCQLLHFVFYYLGPDLCYYILEPSGVSLCVYHQSICKMSNYHCAIRGETTVYQPAVLNKT